MNALQELIADYLAENPGENYSTIARRGGMPRQTVTALAKRSRPRQTPRLDTIVKLATGMGLPLESVKRAAGLTAGYGITNGQMSDRLQSLMDVAADLDDEQLEVVYRRARSLRREKSS